MTTLPDEQEKLPNISIVICTYNRKNLLRMCLNSIYAQDYPESNFEVIVVDGGSTDGTKELCKEFPKIRFITESRFGLAYARNLGAELARGSIVAYTDDDCIVDKLWLRNLIAGFQFSENVMGAGGPVYPLHPEIIPEKILVKAALGLYDEGQEVKPIQGIITSNSAFKTEIFKFIRFDETLGVTRRGKLILCGEDTDFCQTLVASGYRLLYTPYAKVYHQIPQERIRVQYIVKRAMDSGVSRTRVFLKKKHSRIWAVRYSLGQLVQCSLKVLSNTSFTSCYNLIDCISALAVSSTGLDLVLL
ncbi:glycosyltransferase family 2 protein [Candidatus Bathyarchaeota archaeon]|nr:glycosyltransferase family 2 protein [Candidatus Bathyarchaeota archaeon]